MTSSDKQSLLDCVATMTRPAILIDAARHRAKRYQHRRDYRDVMRKGVPNDPFVRLKEYLKLEHECNARRDENPSTYVISRHVDLLGCALGEVDIIERTKT